jgi:hypothetical protein
MKKITLLLLFTSMILIACDARPRSVNIDTRFITYNIDHRTNLCFAMLGYEQARGDRSFSNAQGISFAHVPCTPEVLSLIR